MLGKTHTQISNGLRRKIPAGRCLFYYVAAITPVDDVNGIQSPARALQLLVRCVAFDRPVWLICSMALPGYHDRRLVCRSVLLGRRGRFCEVRRCVRPVF